MPMSLWPSACGSSTGPYQSRRCHHRRGRPSKARFLAIMTRKLVSLLTNICSRSVRNPRMNSSQNICMYLLVRYDQTDCTVQFTHLHPASWDRNPPTIGPMTGPNKGPSANTAVATPRSFESNRSDTIPPPIERHAEPPRPEKMRKMRRDVMFGERAQASSQMANRAVLISKICNDCGQLCDVEKGAVALTILRPNCSLNGAAMREPT